MHKEEYFKPGCEGRVAELLAAHSENYQHTVSLLSALASPEITNAQGRLFIRSLEEVIAAAQKIRAEGQYFAFHTQDSWAERTQSGSPEGVRLFQLVNEKFTQILGLDQGVPQCNEVIRVLKKRNVTKLYTGNLPFEGYGGLKETEDGGDRDVIVSNSLEEGERAEFAQAGIHVETYAFPLTIH